MFLNSSIFVFLFVGSEEFFHPDHVEPAVELAAAFVEMPYLGVAVLGMETDGGLGFFRDAGTEVDDTLCLEAFLQFCIQGRADAAAMGVFVDVDGDFHAMVVGRTLAKAACVAVA